MPFVPSTLPYSPLSMMLLSISTDSFSLFCRHMPMCTPGCAVPSAANSFACAVFSATGFSQNTFTPLKLRP